jgi:hypothetical protein
VKKNKFSRVGFCNRLNNSKTIEKRAKAQFTTTYNLVIVYEVGEFFHHDFKTYLWVDPHIRYRGVILDYATCVQQ